MNYKPRKMIYITFPDMLIQLAKNSLLKDKWYYFATSEIDKHFYADVSLDVPGAELTSDYGVNS